MKLLKFSGKKADLCKETDELKDKKSNPKLLSRQHN